MFKQSIIASIVVTTLFSTTVTNAAMPSTPSLQQGISPEQVLKRLQDGNARFMQNRTQVMDHLKHATITAEQGQHPLAIVLNCVDSRSIANYLFDEGIGNVFVARVAGNVADQNILGSMEFATVYAGVKLIVVMGHTSCGAVIAACQGSPTSTPALDQLLKQIEPAVTMVKHEQGKSFSCHSQGTIDAIARQNVINQMHYVISYSHDIAKLIGEQKIMLVGAMHDLKSGKVTFFDINEHSLWHE